MKYFLWEFRLTLLLACLVTIPSYLVVQAQSPAVDAQFKALAESKLCQTATAIPLAQFQRLSTHWLNNEVSALYISRNFAVLKASHHKHFEALKEFGKNRGAQEVGKDVEEVRRLLTQIDQEHSSLVSSLREVQAADDAFVLSLQTIEEGLIANKSDFSQALKVCSGEDLASIQKIVASLEGWTQDIQKLKLYVVTARNKRSFLMGKTLEGLRIGLLKRHAEFARIDLDKLIRSIDGILAADRLMTQAAEWWVSVVGTQGMGRGFLNFYLNYSESIRFIRIDLVTARDFEQKLEALEAPVHIKTLVKERLNAYSSSLQKALDDTEKKGWKGLFEHQKIYSAKRLELVSRYGEKCGEAIREFDKAATSVKDYETYLKAEKSYMDEVDTCVKRSGT